MSEPKEKKIRLGILASGSGTNTENLVRYFKNHYSISVNACFTNKPSAGVIERMHKESIPCLVFNKELWNTPNGFLELSQRFELDGIILAGFLWLLPIELIQYYEARIINIHPALLPKYGGKGMYGMHVHKAVLANGDKETGITIHLVNEVYDDGEILFQAKTDIFDVRSAEEIASRIHTLEYAHFPKIVEAYFLDIK